MTEANHCSIDVSELEKQANTMLDNIRKATDQHFEFTQDNILQAATVLPIKNFSAKKDALANFGNAEIETLTNHFETIVI